MSILPCHLTRFKYKGYAAAAKSLQSCLTLCDPIDDSPPRSPIPGILKARTLEWVAISFSNAWKWKVKVKSLSRVRLLVTRWTAAYQAPPSMGFSRQEYWSGMPLPSPTKGYTKHKSLIEKQISQSLEPWHPSLTPKQYQFLMQLFQRESIYMYIKILSEKKIKVLNSVDTLLLSFNVSWKLFNLLNVSTEFHFKGTA